MTQPNRYLPIEYDVAGRAAGVVGADDVVLSKVVRLSSAQAQVIVFACDGPVCPALTKMASDGTIQLRRGVPSDGDLDGFAIVFASPSQRQQCARLYAWAVESARLFCALDRPDTSTFVNPAAVDVGGLGLRFFSRGVSPGLVKRLREDIEIALDDPRFAKLVSALRQLRARLREAPGMSRAGLARQMNTAIDGFGLDLRVRYPAWLERGDDPPSDDSGGDGRAD